MWIRPSLMLLVVGAGCLWGCTLVLDRDILTEGEKASSDEGGKVCQRDADCEDAFDCTVERCEDRRCVIEPNHQLCGPLEVCDLLRGCIPGGDECVTTLDCNDGIDCTVDYCQLGRCYNMVDQQICRYLDAPCFAPARCDLDGGGCVQGAPVHCILPDGACMESLCNPASGTCESRLRADADKDDDGYLDAACGGRDCDDEDDQVFPGAPERCDRRDTNCDGYVDVSWFPMDAMTIEVADPVDEVHLGAGDDWAVVGWRRGPRAEVAFLDMADGSADGSADGLVGDVLTLSRLVGEGAVTGLSLVGSPEGVFLVWVVAGETADSVYLVRFVKTEDGVVTSSVSTLATDQGRQVVAPTVFYDENRLHPGWGVVWGQNDTDGGGRLRLQTHDMADVSVVLFDGAQDGQTSATDVGVAGPGEYRVAFSGTYPGMTGENDEVLRMAVAVGTAPEFQVQAPPTVVSSMAAEADDPSWDPVLLLGEQGQEFIVYADRDVFGLMSYALFDVVRETGETLVNMGTWPHVTVQGYFRDDAVSLFYLDHRDAYQVVRHKRADVQDGDVDLSVEVDLLRLSTGELRRFDALAAARMTRGSVVAWGETDDIGQSVVKVSPFVDCVPD